MTSKKFWTDEMNRPEDFQKGTWVITVEPGYTNSRGQWEGPLYRVQSPGRVQWTFYQIWEKDISTEAEAHGIVEELDFIQKVLER